jgi:hypothetical protein
MTVDCVDHFPQGIVGARADGHYEFELPRVSGFALGSRSPRAAGAVCRAVSG